MHTNTTLCTCLHINSGISILPVQFGLLELVLAGTPVVGLGTA